MSLKHTRLHTEQSDVAGSEEPGFDADYWFALIGEQPAAEFLDLQPRTLQGYRYRGGGPRHVRISTRCVKYRRIDLRHWAEARLRTSTSDQGARDD